MSIPIAVLLVATLGLGVLSVARSRQGKSWVGFWLVALLVVTLVVTTDASLLLGTP